MGFLNSVFPTKYAGMVELVDSLDLGVVTLEKVFYPAVIANQSAD